MLSPFSSTPEAFSASNAPSSISPRRLALYGLCLVGAMAILWGAAQIVPQSGPSPKSASPNSAAASAAPDAPQIEIFTWGNGAAALLLAAGALYALYLHRQRGPASSPSRMRTVGKMPLGQSRHLRLVACGGEVLLLGLTDDDIVLLKAYPNDAFENLNSAVPPDGDAPPPGTMNAPEGVSAPDGMSAPGGPSEGFGDVLDRFTQRDVRA